MTWNIKNAYGALKTSRSLNKVVLIAIVMFGGALIGTAWFMTISLRYELKIVEAPYHGQFFCRQLSVILNESASKNALSDLLRLTHGRVLDHIPEIRSYTILLPPPCDAESVLRAATTALSVQGIDSAEPVSPVSLH